MLQQGLFTANTCFKRVGQHSARSHGFTPVVRFRIPYGEVDRRFLDRKILPTDVQQLATAVAVIQFNVK